MEKNNETSAKDMLPENFGSLEAFWDFWDTHSSADYEELTEPVEAEIRLSSQKVYCAKGSVHPGENTGTTAGCVLRNADQSLA